MMIIKAINQAFYIFYLLIIIRIFLTWIPSINWEQQPIKGIRDVTDLYLNVFRKFIPPIGGLDFSPIIALILLQIIQGLLVSSLTKVFM